MKVKDLIDYLESMFPPEYQENYDNSGLLAGNLQAEVNGAMVCLNVTEDVMKEAADKNCNLIISHHPLIFNGLKRITGATQVERLVEQIIRKNFSVYAVHTNVDNSFPGLNSFIASKIGLINTRLLTPRKGSLRKIVTFCPAGYVEKIRCAMFEAGAGVIGNYDSCSFNAEGYGTFRGSDNTQPFTGTPGEFSSEKEVRIETIFPGHLQKKVVNALLTSHPYEEVAYDVYALENNDPRFGAGVFGEMEQSLNTERFLEHIRNVFGVKCLKFSGNMKKPVRNIALCGGSGAFLIQTAIREKADAFITADIRYHEFDHGREDFLLIDAGHYETELFFKEYMVNILSEKFTNFAVHFSESEKNHVLYY